MKLSRKLRFSVLFALIFCVSKSWGAACCGGGFALPSIIAGDDRAVMTGSWTKSKIETDVNSQGVWSKRLAQDQTQTLRLEGAQIFNDRYQAGFSIPVQTREKPGVEGGSSSGLGDISLQGGYEYLPDWDYSPWRPKGIGFLTLVLPTGKSIYETDSETSLDTEGRGFWSVGAGTILLKTYSVWDFNGTLEVHRSFDKNVNHNGFEGKVRPGYGATWGLGAGYNLKDLRIGGALNWSYEDPIKGEGNINTPGSVQRFATGTLSMSYMLPENWATTLSYSDQTLFGEPLNASLSRSVALFLQKRWSR